MARSGSLVSSERSNRTQALPGQHPSTVAFRSEGQPRSPQQLTGEVLDDKYDIIELIGVGGMAYVYRARHTSLDRDVAVKVLSEDANRKALITSRFEREARAVSRLQHPNVLQVTDFGRSADGIR